MFDFVCCLCTDMLRVGVRLVLVVVRLVYFGLRGCCDCIDCGCRRFDFALLVCYAGGFLLAV